VAEFKRGNYWGAADKFKWATKMAPKNANYWSYLSLTYSKVPGRVKEAEEALLTAVKLEPLMPSSIPSRTYLHEGRAQERAFTAFQKALKIDPK